MSSLMKFALGCNSMIYSRAILPTFTKISTPWIFEHNHNIAGQSSSTQVVECGKNLKGWTPVKIFSNSARRSDDYPYAATIIPSNPYDHVEVTIPMSAVGP
jgi:hypothetical protein